MTHGVPTLYIIGIFVYYMLCDKFYANSIYAILDFAQKFKRTFV